MLRGKAKLFLIALAAMGTLAAYMVTGAFGHTGQIVAKCGSISFNYSSFPSNTRGGNQVSETWTVNGVTTNKTENFGSHTSASYSYPISSTGQLTVSASASWSADGGGHASLSPTTLNCGGTTTTTPGCDKWHDKGCKPCDKDHGKNCPPPTTTTVVTTTTQSPPPPPVTTTNTVTTTQTVTTQSPPPPPVTTTNTVTTQAPPVTVTVKVPTKAPPRAKHHRPHRPIKHHKPKVPPKKHVKHPRKPHISYTS